MYLHSDLLFYLFNKRALNFIKKEKSVNKLYYSLITKSVQYMCILVFFSLYAYYTLDCLMIYAIDLSI